MPCPPKSGDGNNNGPRKLERYSATAVVTTGALETAEQQHTTLPHTNNSFPSDVVAHLMFPTLLDPYANRTLCTAEVESGGAGYFSSIRALCLYGQRKTISWEVQVVPLISKDKVKSPRYARLVLCTATLDMNTINKPFPFDRTPFGVCMA